MRPMDICFAHYEIYTYGYESRGTYPLLEAFVTSDIFRFPRHTPHIRAFIMELCTQTGAGGKQCLLGALDGGGGEVNVTCRI